MAKAHRRLAFRLIVPLASLTAVVTLAAFALALYGVSEFVATQARNDLRWRAQSVLRIVESHYEELQRTGRQSDETNVRARKVIALMTAEDFARVNDVQLTIRDADTGRTDVLGVTLSPAAPSLAERLLGAAAGAAAYEMRFEPWQWAITLRQDTRAYRALLQKLLVLASGVGVAFVAGFAALALYLKSIVQRPVGEIVAELRQSRAPQYRGIEEFEFLADSIATMMREGQQADRDRRARQEAEAANRAKSAFLAHMSHELRTPLNAINGFAQLLLMAPNLTPKQQHQLKLVLDSGVQLLALIDDVLDLAKIEAGKVALQREAVDVAAFLRGLEEVCRLRAESRSLGFAVEIPPAQPPRALIDARRLRQVLLNLVDNAIKFTREGSVTLAVRALPPADAAARLRFEVRDTGSGIAPEAQELIFRPFEQAGDANERAAGSGLGLAISRQLVRLMGGELQVHSEPGRGSTFWFELDVPDAAPAAPVPAGATPRPTGYEGPRRRVLVVDDVEENRIVLSEMLQHFGFAVVQAADGRSALETAAVARPDLILMDSVMPGMDGVECTRRLRALGDFRTTPIVTISAAAFKEDIARALAAGADGFLAKPVHVDELVAQLATHLGLRWTY